jgi:hypothetical protein
LIDGAAQRVNVLGGQALGVLEVNAPLVVAEWPYYEHRARAPIDDCRGHAAPKDAGQPGSSVASHYHDRDVLLACPLDDHVSRVPNAHLGVAS